MVEKICADNSITIDDEPSKKANSKYSIIKRKLKELGFGSFYDYLESYISENKNSSYKQYNSSEQLSKLSAKELYDITMEAYGYYSKLPAGTKDNQTTLSANHKTLFGDENLKNIYDISLQPDKDNLPEGVVGTIKRYANTQIDHDKAMELIQQCKNFNPSWSQDEIIEMLGDEALKKKVKIELPQMQQKPLFIRCLLCNNYIPSATDIIDIPLAAAFTKMDVLMDQLPASSYFRNQSPHRLIGAFDVDDFNTINDEMKAYVDKWNGGGFVQKANAFKESAFFGLSALGCNPDDLNGTVPIVAPMRVEDPFLWLLYKNKFILGTK